MLLRAYSVYDRKGLIYHPPFFCVADGVASRMFHDLVNDQQTQIAKHPADYVLFFIGEYDDQKGELRAMVPLAHIIDGSACVVHVAPLFGSEAGELREVKHG